MARSWAELLGDEPAGAGETEGAGFFGRLRDSLGRSRRALTEQLALGSFDPAEEASWERLEEALIGADVGVPATAELVQRLEARGDADLVAALQEEIANMLGDPVVLSLRARPSVILVVGVNGTGKTTTIGKLAAQLREHGRSAQRTRSGQPPRSSSRSGPSVPAPTSSAPSGAAIRPRSRSTRSGRRSRGAGTSSSSTPQAGSTRRRT